MKTSIIILSFLSFISLNSFAKKIDYVSGSSVLIGNMIGHPKCKGEEVQVFIVRKNIVNYQIPVPDKGNFQVHLQPGNYQMVSIDEGGCLAETSFEAKKDSVVKKEIKLEKVGEVSVFDILSILFPEAHAMTMCLQCLQGAQHGYRPMGNPYFGGYPQQRFGYPTPYWGPFGHFSFNRFSSPCPMGGLYPGAYAVLKIKQGDQNRAPASMLAGSHPVGGGFSAGCMGPNYPGTGSMVMGKPNMYFYSPVEKEIKLDFKFGEKGNLLATTPILSNKGVKLTISNDGGFKANKAKYPYFFYDLRTESKNIQQEQGKCVDSKYVVKTMVDYLKLSGFNEKEQKDFYSYWNVKLPKLKKVCIYPQTNENLKVLSQVSIEPKPDHMTRLVFMLVPIINNKFPEKHFTNLPKKDWQPEPKLRSPASASYVVREWGVGFLTIPEVKGEIKAPNLKEIQL